MPASFLHGVEFLETTPSRPIAVVKSGVIALIGTAPKGALQTLTLVQNIAQAALFGSELTGFTIPQALNAIYAQGSAATILVVNVFDPTANVLQVTAESQTVNVTTNKCSLAFNPIFGTLVITNNSASPLTLVKDTDYSLDDYGNITILSYANMSVDNTLKCSYKKADFSGITSTNIIGATSGSNVRTGCALFDLAYNTFGFKGKIFISPGYSNLSAVADKLDALAVKFKGVSLIDAPIGTSFATAISGRGPAGTINFYRNGTRTILLYPGVKATNLNTLAIEVRYRSAYLAGLIANVDYNEGYWVSPSNHNILGISGDELPLSFDIQDSTCDANSLNALGIVTSANAFGTGYLNWGNRNAAFPNNTSVDSFINIRRTWDIVEESIGIAMLNYIDVNNISQACIDLVRNTVNNFINILIGRGALLPGTKLSYNKDINPASQLATGQVVFTLSGLTPPPMERMTFNVNYDLTLLNQFK